MTNVPQILIITNLDDFAADYLIVKLMESHYNFLRINSEDIAKWLIQYDPKVGITLEYEDTIYSLSSVASVYFRRAPTVFKHFRDNEDKNYLWRECKEFYEGIYLTLKAKWINPIFETYKAERKLYQLSLAKNIGFSIPSSLISNDPNKIKNFISNQKSIIKPISHGLQITDTCIYSIYTNDVDDDIDFSLKESFESPVYVQEKVQNLFDIRVTVVNEQIFPVGIRTRKGDVVDWRRPEIIKEYEVIELPQSIADKCIQITKNLGLVYSAIDLIKSDNGKYTFLEINPAGEWVWLERELNLPISNMLIQELGNQ